MCACKEAVVSFCEWRSARAPGLGVSWCSCASAVIVRSCRCGARDPVYGEIYGRERGRLIARGAVTVMGVVHPKRANAPVRQVVDHSVLVRAEHQRLAQGRAGLKPATTAELRKGLGRLGGKRLL